MIHSNFRAQTRRKRKPSKDHTRESWLNWARWIEAHPFPLRLDATPFDIKNPDYFSIEQMPH